MAAPPFDARALGSLPGLEWKARYVMEGFLPGLHGSPFHGPSVDFRDYRDYQPGDDLRRLDWRLYARNDRLCVRRYEQETNARCYLLLDTSASMGYQGQAAWASKLEAARVLGLAVGFMLLGQSDAVGLLSVVAPEGAAAPVRYVRPSQKPHQAGALVGELARLTPQGGPVLARLLDAAARLAHRRSLLVLVSDLLEPSEQVARELRRLRFDGHECVCLQVLDGDEVEFPFVETAVFEDMETGERRRVAGSEAGPGYRARFAEFLSAWQDLFLSLDVPHAVVRTDQDPGRALRRFFSHRPPRGARR